MAVGTSRTESAPSSSIYDRRWRKARAQFLRERPLCVEHERRGELVQAEVVDHITPHRGDRRLFWDRANWQPLCKQCHDSHKQRAEKSGRVIGCDESGLPVDPLHHWRVSGGGGGIKSLA